MAQAWNTWDLNRGGGRGVENLCLSTVGTKNTRLVRYLLNLYCVWWVGEQFYLLRGTLYSRIPLTKLTNHRVRSKLTDKNNDLRLLCKKILYRFLGRFLFLAGSSWRVLTWKAAFFNSFCWFLLHFWGKTCAKKLSFSSNILGANPLKVNRPCIEPVSWQSKLESGPFSPIFACTNEATIRD